LPPTKKRGGEGNARPEDEISATRAGSKKTDLQRDQKDGGTKRTENLKQDNI
jgi:hypothetical protein